MDLVSDLMAIGFTEYESKVYLALLRENPATGYQISKAAGVPRSMVYEALGRLSMRGAVLSTGDKRGTLYRPLPPDMLLDRYEQEHRSLMSDLRAGLTALYAAPEEGHFWSISGRNAVIAYAAQMIQGAQNEVLLTLADPDLEALRADIQSACERGVTVSALLTGEGELDCGRVARHPRPESEIQGLTEVLVVVVDKREALIANIDPNMTATITSNRNLVLIARQFVWMELFAQHVHARLGDDLLARLDPDDRWILEGAISRLEE